MNIPFKTKLPDQTTLAERNKVFDNLSDEDKRKEIAFDGLNLVITGQVGAARGMFWNAYLLAIADELETPQELQNVLNYELPEGCQVCQRGLMMLSQIRLGNSVSPSDFNADCGSDENIKGFTMAEFGYMEGEYEVSRYRHPYTERTKRKLANICCNVIANGYFDTDDRTDYLKKWDIKINLFTLSQAKDK